MEVKVTARKAPELKTVMLEKKVSGGELPSRAPRIMIKSPTLDMVEIRQRSFDKFTVMGATFTECRFLKTKFKSGSFGELAEGIPQSKYTDCIFDRVRIDRYMQVGNARFERCRFIDSKIVGLRSRHAEFLECTFTGELRDCWFMGTTEREPYAQRERNEFRGNDFTGAELIACQFDYGIDVTAQVWPAGPNYLILDRLRDRTNLARGIVSRWPNDEEREYVLANLQILRSESLEDQDIRIVRRDDWVPAMPKLRNIFFDLLQADPDLAAQG